MTAKANTRTLIERDLHAARKEADAWGWAAHDAARLHRDLRRRQEMAEAQVRDLMARLEADDEV